MDLTPNSKVSRTASVQVDGGEFADLLNRVTLDSPPAPVRILFESSGVSVWTLNVSKTIQCLITRWPLAGLKVKEPCVILADPKDLSDVVRAKSRGEAIRISTNASEPIMIGTKNQGGAEVMPADEDDCLLIPDRWVLPHDENGNITFPMFDNQPATATAEISVEELRKAYHEMMTAKAPYVVITFDNKSEARSGHWTSKTTRSWVPLEAKVNGPFTMSMTESFKTLLNLFHSSTTMLKISKHEDGQFVAIEAMDGPSTTTVATEAIKEA
tara:strand:- start:9726 stop:10535 length:810 start_codon:yes stop_codon:yes gene_type:complete